MTHNTKNNPIVEAFGNDMVEVIKMYKMALSEEKAAQEKQKPGSNGIQLAANFRFTGLFKRFGAVEYGYVLNGEDFVVIEPASKYKGACRGRCTPD